MRNSQFTKESDKLLKTCAIIGLLAVSFLILWLQVNPDRSSMGYLPLLTLPWGIAIVVLGAWASAPVKGLWVPIGIGLILRLMLLGQDPLLSDDLYRYLWEGMVLNHGENPLLKSPDLLSAFDPTLHQSVNHSHLASIYPPFALRWFQLVDVLGGQLAVIQTLTTAADGLILWGIGLILKQSKQPLWPLWIYALHPLAVLESGWSSHIDIVALCFAVWGLWAVNRHQKVLSFWLCAMGGFTKLFPLLWAPRLFRALTPAQRSVSLLLTVGSALFLAWPVLSTDSTSLNSLKTFSEHWEFNGFLYPALSVFLGTSTRPVLYGIAALLGLLVYWRTQTVPQLWFGFALIFLATSPTVHPWYGLWLLVPACILQRRGAMLACVFMMNAYAVLLGLSETTGTWDPPPWLWWATWIPVLGALSLDTSLWRPVKNP